MSSLSVDANSTSNIDLKALVFLHHNLQLESALLGVDDESLDENET